MGVVVQYSSSQLTDFTGLLYQDSLSHRHLNLRSDLPHVELHHQHDYRRRLFSRHQCVEKENVTKHVEQIFLNVKMGERPNSMALMNLEQ